MVGGMEWNGIEWIVIEHLVFFKHKLSNYNIKNIVGTIQLKFLFNVQSTKLRHVKVSTFYLK